MKKFFIISVSILVILPTILLLWGLYEPYFLDTQLHEFDLPRLEEEITVVQLSDFQIGMWRDNTATVKKAIRQTIAITPDAVVITGDFIYHTRDIDETEIDHVVHLLEPLTSTEIPIFAVLGNHDYGVLTQNDDPYLTYTEDLISTLENAGIKVLENESTKLNNLQVVGIGSYVANRSDPEKAFSEVLEDEPRLTIMHHPNSFESIDPGQAPLALAGHTHGGQIALPFLPESSWVSYRSTDKVHTDGWIQDYGQDGNQLYVNRGIGFSVLPLRIGAPPELTIFRLY